MRAFYALLSMNLQATVEMKDIETDNFLARNRDIWVNMRPVNFALVSHRTGARAGSLAVPRGERL